MATIKQIDKHDIHRIQSGQVIVDLCSVVKELVENSVDAGATTIDVRFKNQGLDLIEVQDNGGGISPDNYQSVALKHHTSKLSSYADISTLQTFGFRGEALASLCALSTVGITTCLAQDVPKGTALSFEASGALMGTSVVAAQKGTTVSVEKLFHNLPVRRRELERNIKREWQKVISLLNQYACIQTNLKFSVSQQPSKGKRIILFSTKGNATIRENLINIFSAKTVNALVALDLELEMSPTATLSRARRSNTDATRTVRVLGHVSRPVHGEGRQTPDRQMFFVNGRPCGLPQFAKVFNEVYRAYNSNQSPFICADIQLDTDLYDVNVSPDKRSIMLHDQNKMLDSLRTALIALFDDQGHSVPVSAPAHAPHSTPATSSTTGRQTPMSTFRFTHQTTNSSPLAAQTTSAGDDNESDDEEDGEEAPAAFTPAIVRSARSSARRVGSSNSLSRGGQQEQSLLHHWVHQEGSSSSTTTPALATKRSGDKSLSAASEKHESPSAKRGEVHEDGNVASDEEEGASEEVNQASQGEDIDMSHEEPNPTLNETHANVEETSSRRTTHIETAATLHARMSSREIDAPIPSIESVKKRRPEDEVLPVARSPLKRSAPELATVTIDNETSTTWIGPSPKRARSVSSQPGTQPTPPPSFGGRLTAMFAAGGPRHSGSASKLGPQKDDDEDEEEEEEEEEEEDEDEEESTKQRESSRDGSKEEQSLFVQDMERDQHTQHTRGEEDVEMDSSQGSDHGGHEKAGPERPRSVASASPSASSPPSSRLQPPISPTASKPRTKSLDTPYRKKDNTTSLRQYLSLSEGDFKSLLVHNIVHDTPLSDTDLSQLDNVEDVSAAAAESKLSLSISRNDFSRMRIAGQFNLGFMIATRPTSFEDDSQNDELFIIDQHASDEKYNFERLQYSTVVASQRMVQPKRLELTALEEEIVMQNMEALEKNGFKVEMDLSGEAAVGGRCHLTALPLSRETTFNITDLEELIALLGDNSSESSHVPRPSKVRKMFAMRACRSSIMIGKALTHGQMYGLVKHMGEMDKPWNCPHGRPTMRHLCQLKVWDQKIWRDDGDFDVADIWADYLWSIAST